MKATTIRSVVAFSLFALIATACSSGSSKSDASSTTGSPTTSSKAHSAKSAASAADARLARTLTLTAADLGARWRPYKNPPPVSPVTRGCGYTRTGPLAGIGLGALYAGAQMKFKANRSYAESSTLVFPDDARAIAWVKVRTTSVYKGCRRRAFDAQLRHQVKTDRVVRTSLKDPHVGTTVPGGSKYADFTRYNGQYRFKGRYYTNATYDLFLYRHGRVVISFELDRQTSVANDPRAREVEATLAQGIAKVLARAAKTK